jgi:hypothetical protein
VSDSTKLTTNQTLSHIITSLLYSESFTQVNQQNQRIINSQQPTTNIRQTCFWQNSLHPYGFYSSQLSAQRQPPPYQPLISSLVKKPAMRTRRHVIVTSQTSVVQKETHAGSSLEKPLQCAVPRAKPAMLSNPSPAISEARTRKSSPTPP